MASNDVTVDRVEEEDEEERRGERPCMMKENLADSPSLLSSAAGETNDDEPRTGFYRRTLGGLTGRACLFVLIVCLQLGVTLPLAPRMVEDHFASDDAGITIHCGDYTIHDRPDVCKRASSKASAMQITCDSLKCLLAFILAPMIGKRSDIFGRMPYILPLSCMIGLPNVSLLLCDFGWIGLAPYFFTTAISPLYILLSLSTSYAADALLPEDRAAGFGLVLGGFGVGLSVSPCMSIFLSRRVMLWFGAAVAVICPLYCLVGMPESLKASERQTLSATNVSSDGNTAASDDVQDDGCDDESHCAFSKNRCCNPFAPLSILGESPIFKVLAVTLFLVAVITDGTTNLDSYYVTDVFGFSTQQLAAAFMFVGIGTVVCQILMLKTAVGLFGEKGVLLISCVCIVASKLGYFFVGLFRPEWKWFVYVQYISLCPIILWAFPALSAMKANIAPRSKQGSIQGALFGVRCLAQGVCPPLFAVVYGELNGKRFPDHPATTYLVLAVVGIAATAIAYSIPNDWRSYRIVENGAKDDDATLGTEETAVSVEGVGVRDAEAITALGDPLLDRISPARLKRGVSLFASV